MAAVLQTPLPVSSSFGALLKFWRKKQGLSQLELALMADVSQRHVSFLESGRSLPTQDMILRLAGVLALPLRTQNLMLSAAGFSPLYSENNLEAPELASVRQALAFLLRQQEPYPALVMDRNWNLLQANQSAHLLLGKMCDLAQLSPVFFPQGLLNIMLLTLHPQGLMPCLENGEQVAAHLMQRLMREAMLAGPDSLAAAIYNTLQPFFLRLNTSHGGAFEGHAPVLSSVFVKNDLRLSLFSTITTLGTPADITLQELRIESFFPADAETDVLIKALLQVAAV